MSGHTLRPSDLDANSDADDEPDAEPETAIDSGLRRKVESVSTDEFLIINNGSRTWEVVNVIDRNLSLEDDPLESLRILRVRTGDRHRDRLRTGALVLRRYPARAECELHILTSPRSFEEGSVQAVSAVEVLNTMLPWVVAGRGPYSSYHFPDPFAAARGEAAPVCDRAPVEMDYRLVRLEAVYPAKRACKACARHHRPREIERVCCPECEHGLARGLLHGRRSEAVTGVAVECSNPRCEFEGVVDLAD